MSHVELLVHCESPFISIVADATNLSLSSHVLSIKSMALGITIEKLFGFDSLSIGLSSYHTFTESLILFRHRASTKHFNIVLLRCTLLIDNLALLVRVSRCAVVRRIGYFTIELDSIR